MMESDAEEDNLFREGTKADFLAGGVGWADDHTPSADQAVATHPNGDSLACSSQIEDSESQEQGMWEALANYASIVFAVVIRRCRMSQPICVLGVTCLFVKQKAATHTCAAKPRVTPLL